MSFKNANVITIISLKEVTREVKINYKIINKKNNKLIRWIKSFLQIKLCQMKHETMCHIFFLLTTPCYLFIKLKIIRGEHNIVSKVTIPRNLICRTELIFLMNVRTIRDIKFLKIVNVTLLWTKIQL